VDYIDVNEQIILDAKYKPRYKKGDIGITEDVREISGYARDKKILKVLKWNANIADKNGKLLPDCVIVYPVVQVEENDNGELSGVVAEKACSCKYEFDKNASIVSQCDEIKAFEGLYKIAIPLPKK
jgi:5-methylcytosine-specific restriction enzyme subunit McrC